MISIIICSADPSRLTQLKKNIEETIGVPFELIGIDNSVHRHGICKVYNEGGKKAKFPFLCFMHEDISFETRNWGAIACAYLENDAIGLIGIAGGDTKSLLPSSWSVPFASNEINIIQHYKFNKSEPKHIIETAGNGESLKEVVVLDGVWLCTRREVFRQFRFDEETFTGFHGYDIDYSLQVGTRYKLAVTFDISLHHYSDGNPSRGWISSAVSLSRKWKRTLPVSTLSLTHRDYTFHHWRSMQVLLQHLFRLKYSYPAILKFYLSYSFTRFFSLRRFISAGKYILTTRRGIN